MGTRGHRGDSGDGRAHSTAAAWGNARPMAALQAAGYQGQPAVTPGRDGGNNNQCGAGVLHPSTKREGPEAAWSCLVLLLPLPTGVLLQETSICLKVFWSLLLLFTWLEAAAGHGGITFFPVFLELIDIGPRS